MSGVRGMVLLGAGGMQKGNGSPSECEGAVPRVTKQTRGRRRTALGVGVAGGAAGEAAQEAALFAIYAHPSDLDAQAAAERLRQALSSTAASSGDNGRAASTAVLLQQPSNCPGCGIYFNAGGHVELLASGESAGKGLKSELPKVLLDLCSREGCRHSPPPALCVQGCESSCHCTSNLCASFPPVRVVMDAGVQRCNKMS